jgi:hypothetical protein
MIGENCPNFEKSSQNTCQAQNCPNIYIKVQFESPKHLHKTFQNLKIPATNPTLKLPI